MANPIPTTIPLRTRRNQYRLNDIDVQSVNRVLQDISLRLDQLDAISQNPDMRGRIITNLGAAFYAHDAVRKDQVTDLVDGFEKIYGTVNQITVTDNGDNTVTLSIPTDPVFSGVTLSGLTANRLVYANISKAIASISDLTQWIGSGSGIQAINDGDGTCTIATGQLSTSTHTTSQVLTLSDFFKIHIFNSASDLICTLPTVGIANLGWWVIIIRAGTGKLSIYAVDSDTILDSSAPGAIECNDPLYDNCIFSPLLITETQWGPGPINFGRWGTI